jgi:hypothetical protein
VPRQRRLRWLWLPGVGALLIVGAVAGVALAIDLYTVRSSLASARSSLQEVRAAAGEVDVAQASAALDRADRELADARVRSSSTLWSLAARVPIAGDSVEVTSGVVRVASAAVAIGRVAVRQGEELLGTGLEVQVEDDRIDLTPLLAARDVLDRLPLERLVRAHDDLLASDPTWVPGELADGRLEMLSLAEEAIGSIERGREFLSALPSFLGTEGPRRYFLGIQTPAELRGTGGLITYYTVLTVDDGSFELGASEIYEATADDEDADEPTTARIGQLGAASGEATVDEEFAAHYGHTGAQRNFSNVNVDPDLPTTAAVALDLFEVRTGEQLDGMVLVDPVAMGTILSAIGGELAVPEDLQAQGGLPPTIAPADFARFATADMYEVFGEAFLPQRHELLQALGDGAFDLILAGGWDGVAVGQALGEAATSRNLQVNSVHASEQAAFEAIDIAGALMAPAGSDLFAVTANNAVGGKQDVHVGHHVVLDLELTDPRELDGQATVWRRAAVRTQLDNPLPSEGMDLYVIGNCLIGGDRNQCFAGPPGENRTWFTVWTPADTALLDARDDGRVTWERSADLRGFRVHDRYLEVPSRSTGAFELDLEGVAPVRRDGLELVYELAWWEQAKAIPTLLDVTIAPPVGWAVTDVEMTGGGSGRGFGVHGQGQPLEVGIQDGSARLSGTVTADTRLRIRMSPAPGA